MAIVWKWSLIKLIKTIVATLLNKYDFFAVIEGTTGSGKSTLAVLIAMGVKREFRKLKNLDYDTVKYYYDILQLKYKGISEEDFVGYLLNLEKEKSYDFKLNKHLLYNKEEMQVFLDGWKGIAISDEMINVAFNRDFFSEGSKNIIKLLNMMRDHNNLTLACVPSFNVLDNQIKNLCKMRLSVVRRGVALIQTPNKTFYGKDKWDTSFNEKLERTWLMNKSKRPQYAKLTTFRGIVRFPKLNPRVEGRYQKVKDLKRSKILKEEMGIDFKKEVTVEDKIYDRLLTGGVKNMEFINGMAMANDSTLDSLRAKLRRKLIQEGKNPLISSYFYDKKARKKGDHDVEGISS